MKEVYQKIGELKGKQQAIDDRMDSIDAKLDSIKSDVQIKSKFMRFFYILGAILGALATGDMDAVTSLWHTMVSMF